jgi:hypothetical protein
MATIELPAPLNLTIPVHPVILNAVEGIIGQVRWNHDASFQLQLTVFFSEMHTIIVT